MRHDMAKVVTEKPRRGHSNRSKKHGRRLTRGEVDAIVVSEAETPPAGDLPAETPPVDPPAQMAPSRAKVSRNGQYGWHHKEFSDRLGPLRKYLRRQVGRPWNTVYSEMNASLDKRSLTGLHIWDHVKYEVEIHTYLGPDGKTVYPCPRWRWVTAANQAPVAGLYVHPRTGLLCYKPRDDEQARDRTRTAARPVIAITLSETERLEQIDGLWYATVYGKATRYHAPVILHKGTHHERVFRVAHFEEYDVRTAKRQLSRAELRAHGLRNVTRDVWAAPMTRAGAPVTRPWHSSSFKVR